MQVKMWPKNADGIKQLAERSNGVVTPSKLINFIVAQYLVAKKDSDPNLFSNGKKPKK